MREQSLTREEIAKLCSLHKGIDLDEEGGDQGSECDEEDKRYGRSDVTPAVHLLAPLGETASLREMVMIPSFRGGISMINAESGAQTHKRLLVKEDLDEDGLLRAIRENFNEV